MKSNEVNSTEFYHNLLKAFIETGEVPDASLYADDALTMYLYITMSDVRVASQVLSDEIAARIFMDTMMQFVSQSLQKAAFQYQRCSSERIRLQDAKQWSHTKRRDNWKALVQEVGEQYSEFGFEQDFYMDSFSTKENWRDDALWQTLLHDWSDCMAQRLEQQKREQLKSRVEAHNRQLHTNLEAATRYVKQHGISAERFCQSWALMGGRWNLYEYERLQRVVQLQQRYPVLQQITDKMGRVANAAGKQRIGYASGQIEQMSHASKSDIVGIGMGNDLNTLLPSELAQFFDTEMEKVFLHKYVTHCLQTFDYQSRLLNPARSLHTRPAQLRGPIIVCVDTSGSMQGEPYSIALSLMMKLSEVCGKERRRCYLVAFSVQATPIDVLQDRTKLLDFFTRHPTGDTDARRMLATIFALLHENPLYAGADVLWVTDFRIPLPPKNDLYQMQEIRKRGTRFYGLQIGIAENRWLPYFDEMYQIS